MSLPLRLIPSFHFKDLVTNHKCKQMKRTIRLGRTPPTYNKGHRKKLALTNRFYLTFFLNSIGLLAKKEKNHNNVT